MCTFRLLFLAAVGAFALAAASTASATPPPWAKPGGGGGGHSIGLIAPWGSAALTGTDTISLTYTINASSNVSSSAVQKAYEAAGTWASWLSSHDGNGHFNVQQGIGGGVNVPITLKNGGGTIAGSTKLSFDRRGFVSAATVQVSARSFGSTNSDNIVYEITLHELGHAFVGLNHSDDPNDLMYPTINGSMSIGSCETNGFNALYGWLEDGSSSTPPTLPSSSSVAC